MNWWPFGNYSLHGKCIEEIAKQQNEINGYKCALDSHLSQINELKAVYNYQVADLEGKIQELSDDNDGLFKANGKLSRTIESYKRSEKEHNDKILEMSKDLDMYSEKVVQLTSQSSKRKK